MRQLGRYLGFAIMLCMGGLSLTANAQRTDFTGNGVDELAYYEPATGVWRIRGLGGIPTYDLTWGGSTFYPVPGDYSGDGQTDLAVYHRTSGKWYINTLGGTAVVWDHNWGYSGAHAVGAGDYNGDGRTDLALFAPATGLWYIQSVTGQTIAWAFSWGWGQAQMVPGDYNGDGRTDFAIYDRMTGKWYIITLGGQLLAWGLDWGWPEARPVPGDFNGDGRADIAVYHRQTGTWYIRSLDGSVIAWAENWGWNEARPVAGDFNGDGRTDMAVYHSGSGEWYIRSVTGPTLAWASFWGTQTAVPVSHYGNGAEGFVTMAFGDSITYGRGSSSNEKVTSYPAFLDEILDVAVGGFAYVVNVGFSGETTVQGRQRFARELNTHQPDLVLLLQGTNDLRLPGRIGQVINNLTWMANVARSQNRSVVMSTMVPIAPRPFVDRQGQHAQIIQANVSVRSRAQQLGWPYAENYNAIASQPDWPNTMYKPNQSLHPNNSGYTIMSQEFLRAIREGLRTGKFVY